MKLSASLVLSAALSGVAQAFTSFAIYDQQFHKGSTTSFSVDNDGCHGLPSGWNDRIRSFRAAEYNNADTYCIFYNDAKCQGASHYYEIKAPSGTSISVNQIPTEFDKKWSSIQCAHV